MPRPVMDDKLIAAGTGSALIFTDGVGLVALANITEL